MRDIDPLNGAVGERLRALPEENAEPYGWEEFRRRTPGAARGDGRRATAAVLSLRAAAAILLLAGATALAAWMWGGSERPSHLSAETGASSLTMAAAQPGARFDPADARARAMEGWLARQPAEPAMVRVGAYATEAGLEDRIAELDDLLTTARAEGVGSARLSPLEEQRARLVSSLVQVRFAETLVSDSPR